MEIPRTLVEQYAKRLGSLSEAAQKAALDELRRIEWADVADLREQALEVLSRYLPYATDIAAQHSADFYDAVRTLAVGEELGAEAVSGYNADATEGAVRAFAQSVVETGATGAFLDRCAERIDYDVKRSAANATAHNCGRDPLKPKWARIPVGHETCMFCLMLASRGFVYSSEENAGGHWHAHCDCRAMQGYPGMTVAGYDPDYLYDVWKHPEKHPEYRDARNARRLEL